MSPLASPTTSRPSSPVSTDSDTHLSSIKKEKLRRRRFTKHVVERKRRDRINSTLEELKGIILKECQKNPEHYDKMEKAEILDMTLQFIRAKCSTPKAMPIPQYPMAAATYNHHLNQQQHHRLHTAPVNMPLPGFVAPVPTVTRNAGYQACREDVTRFMQMSSVPAHLKSGLMKNLGMNIPEYNVTVPSKTDNLCKQRAAFSHVNVATAPIAGGSGSAGSRSLQQVAPADSSPVWRPF